MERSKSMRNPELDSLRAFSVMLVVAAHAGFNFIPGGFGVTVFFVISGYIITRLLLEEFSYHGNIDIRKFYFRRFWKLFPPFLAIIFIPSIIFFYKFDLNGMAILAQLFFYFNWYKELYGSVGVLPGTGVVWSLSIEEQFYIAIALCVSLTLKLKSSAFISIFKYTFVALWILSTAFRLGLAHIYKNSIHDETGNLPRIYLGTDTRISSICIGGLLAILSPTIGNRKFVSKFTSVLLVFVSILVIFSTLLIRDVFFRDSIRFTLQEFSVAILIFTGVVLKMWPSFLNALARNRLIQKIGLASYSIYLSHLILIILITNLFDINETQIGYQIIQLVLIVLVVAAGIALHHLFDLPFEKQRQKYRRLR